jgi:hypothetical protein
MQCVSLSLEKYICIFCDGMEEVHPSFFITTFFFELDIRKYNRYG